MALGGGKTCRGRSNARIATPQSLPGPPWDVRRPPPTKHPAAFAQRQPPQRHPYPGESLQPVLPCAAPASAGPSTLAHRLQPRPSPFIQSIRHPSIPTQSKTHSQRGRCRAGTEGEPRLKGCPSDASPATRDDAQESRRPAAIVGERRQCSLTPSHQTNKTKNIGPLSHPASTPPMQSYRCKASSSHLARYACRACSPLRTADRPMAPVRQLRRRR